MKWGPSILGTKKPEPLGVREAAAAPWEIGSPWEAPPALPRCLGRSHMTL